MKERLAVLTARYGFTQKQMSTMLGVPITTYRQWTNGIRKPNAILKSFLDFIELVELTAPVSHKIMLDQIRSLK